MNLKIIGAGFGRTGTASLKAALEQLGFTPCHHMIEVIANPEQVSFWDRAALGWDVNWEDVFAPYRASCDWPSCFFYQQLAAFYPDAKIILTVRDPKAWYKSVEATILPAMKKPKSKPGPGERSLPGIFAPVIIGDKTFGYDFSEAHMIDVFERHNEEVKRTISASRLLVFEATQGWDPLCEFLGAKVPDAPYPKTNTSEEFQTRVRGGLSPVKTRQS